MKTKKTTRTTKKKTKPAGAGTISAYIKAQDPQRAKICRVLLKAIKATLPKAESKMYHGLPVWFVGENAVVGFRITAKSGVNLLFWNGQALGEPELKRSGKFMAAEIQFQDAAEINATNLKRWLKKAGKDIWDFAGLRKQG